MIVCDPFNKKLPDYTAGLTMTSTADNDHINLFLILEIAMARLSINCLLVNAHLHVRLITWYKSKPYQ